MRGRSSSTPRSRGDDVTVWREVGARNAKRLRTGALAGVALAASAVALVGAMHTRAARPLLARLGVKMGCPVSLEGRPPEEIEAARARSLAPLRVGDRA